MKTACSLFIFLLITATVSVAQAPSVGQIGLYLDENHSEYCLDGSGIYQAEIWVWCRADEDGHRGIEFMVQYPDNVILSTVTYNTDIGVFETGNLENGSWTFAEECQYSWFWTHRQIIYIIDDQPSRISIVPYLESSTVNFFECDYELSLVPADVVSDLLVNCTSHVFELTGAESTDPQLVSASFSRPLDPTTAEEISNYEVFLASDTSESISITAADRQTNRTEVLLVLGEPLIPNIEYTLRVNGVRDEHGNEIEPDATIQFTFIDDIPPVPLTTERVTNQFIHLEFNEYLDPATAEDAGNYLIVEVRDSMSTVPVISVSLAPDSVSNDCMLGVVLVDSLDYLLGITGVEDRYGNATLEGTGIVIEEIEPPRLLEAWAEEPHTAVWARFDEEVDEISAENVENYRLYLADDPEDSVVITTVELDTDDKPLRFSLSELLLSQTSYTLRAKNVADLIGNVDSIGSEIEFTTQAVDFTLVVIELTVPCYDCPHERDYHFASNQASIYEKLGTPGPPGSGYDGYDFSTSLCEYFDVYFSDSAGIPLGIGPGDQLPDPVHLTIECMHLDCNTMQPVSAPSWASAGHDLEAVSVDYADSDLIGVEITRYSYGLCDEPVERKRNEYVWAALGRVRSGLTAMGGGFSSVTIRLADEPPPPVVSGIQAYDPDFMYVRFNRDLNQQTVEETGHYSVTRKADPLDSMGIVSAEFVANRGVNLFFAEPIVDDTVYTLRIAGVEDASGTPNPANMELDFVLIDDFKPLMRGADRIDAWTVKVWFSEPVQEASATDPANYNIYDDEETYTIAVSSASLASSGDSITLFLTDSLDIATTYFVEATDILDLHDNPIHGTYNKAVLPDGVRPYPVEVQVVSLLEIEIVFSEKIGYGGTGSSYHIYRTDDATSVVGVQSVWPDDATVRLLLGDMLEAEVNYTIEINEVKDNAGNMVALGTSITFDANGTVPPRLLSAEALDSMHVLLIFNNRLDETSAETVSNYDLTPYGIPDWRTVDIASAELQVNATDVVLTLTDSLESTYKCIIVVDDIIDETGTPMPWRSVCEFTYYADEMGYIGLFADSNRAYNGVEGVGFYQTEMWIWCLPSENRQKCAEFRIDYPANCIPSTVTPNSELISVTLGNLASGMSVCYNECQNDWNWCFHQTIYITSTDTTEVSIVEHPVSGVYQFANCLPGYPTEPCQILHGLFLNLGMSTATVLLRSSAEYVDHCIRLVWNLSSVDEEIVFFVSRSTGGEHNFIALDSPGITRDNLTFTVEDRDFEQGSTYRYRVEYAVTGGERKLLFETDPVRTPSLPLTLYQNHPNPFNPTTTIGFYLPNDTHLSLAIFDVSGRLIKRLERGQHKKGFHEAHWDGCNESGHQVGSGIYFYRLSAGKKVISKKMVLLR